jgi:hypothetical protein
MSNISSTSYRVGVQIESTGAAEANGATGQDASTDQAIVGRVRLGETEELSVKVDAFGDTKGFAAGTQGSLGRPVMKGRLQPFASLTFEAMTTDSKKSTNVGFAGRAGVETTGRGVYVGAFTGVGVGISAAGNTTPDYKRGGYVRAEAGVYAGFRF